MSSRHTKIYFFIILTILVSCKNLTYKNHAKSLTISFGRGGGFTGEINEYILSGNGLLKLKNSFSNDTVLIKKIQFKEIKDIFKRAESESLMKINLNKPSNMTRFINIYRKNNLLKSFKWPSEDRDIPVEVLDLYNLLTQLQ